MDILSTLAGLMTSYFVNLTNDHVLYDYIKQLQRGGEPVNHDLQKAVKRAYLGALQNIVQICYQAALGQSCRRFPLGPRSYPPECKAELEWLDGKFTQLARELKQLNQWGFLGTVFESLEEVESLLYPKGESAQARIREFEQKFVAHALEHADPSTCYQETVRQELFRRISDYFADEIKHNPEARHIFDSQILAQLKTTVQEQNATMQKLNQKIQELDDRLSYAWSARARMVLEVEIEELQTSRLQMVMDYLREHGQEVNLTIKRAEAGSLVLLVEGDQTGLERLAILFQDGKMQEIHGMPVKDFRIVSAPARQSQSARTGEGPAQILINGLRYLLEAITPPWMPEMAGQLPSAADISFFSSSESQKAISGPLPDMEFVWIPPGEFMMGSPKDEPGRSADEKQHKVILTQGFYMQTTPVTQGQWEALMGDNPSRFKDCGPDCPVENVSWNDARQFIKKLNENSEPFWTGKCLDTYQANYDGNYPLKGCPKGEDRGKTTPVKTFDPNPWGLYDMHGNVWEWCSDWYGEYPDSPVTDPERPSDGAFRVIRGGSWDFIARFCRSAYRFSGRPDDRDDFQGLRALAVRRVK